MCHMFLVPVFETGSLRTFQQSAGAHRRTRARGRASERGWREWRRKQRDTQRGDREGGRDERRMRDRWRGERRWMDGREEG